MSTLKRAAELLRNPAPRDQASLEWFEQNALAAELEAMAEQEPVAWLCGDETTGRITIWYPEDPKLPPPWVQEPIYAAPQPAQRAPAVPEGWQLVPEEPTHEMLSAGAGSKYEKRARNVWRDMLAAAPKEPK